MKNSSDIMALQRDLIATISHDLKQPLSVISGYLELLQLSQKLDERGVNFVEEDRDVNRAHAAAN